MKYHDFHLQGYEVTEKGKTITFHLLYDYPDAEKEESNIKFNDVVLYNFTHTSGAIITDIEEVDVSGLVHGIWNEIKEWNRMYGVSYWEADIENYISSLKNTGFKAWEITSAIGFYGFLIAKNIKNS